MREYILPPYPPVRYTYEYSREKCSSYYRMPSFSTDIIIISTLHLWILYILKLQNVSAKSYDKIELKNH